MLFVSTLGSFGARHNPKYHSKPQALRRTGKESREQIAKSREHLDPGPDKDADGTAVYRRSDGPPGFRTGRACRSHALFAENTEGNTTAPAADTVWINVGAVRGVQQG